MRQAYRRNILRKINRLSQPQKCDIMVVGIRLKISVPYYQRHSPHFCGCVSCSSLIVVAENYPHFAPLHPETNSTHSSLLKSTKSSFGTFGRSVRRLGHSHVIGVILHSGTFRHRPILLSMDTGFVELGDPLRFAFLGWELRIL